MMLFNSKGKRYGIVALLLVLTVLLCAGCPYGAVPGGVLPPPQYAYERPAITTDGSGGAIVFYALQEEDLGRKGYWCEQRRFYVQRVDKEGNFLWGDSVLVGRGYIMDRLTAPLALELASDESGGVIVVWRATSKMRTPEETHAIHVARLSPQGEILWQREFRRSQEREGLAPARRLLVISDASGGAIIGWGLGVQRIDSDGQFLWGENGITVFYHDGVVTTKGALILVWAAGDGTIRAQKITAEAEALWSEGGIQVGKGVGPQVTTDRLGGAIITWTRLSDKEDSPLPAWEILAKRIDAHGNYLWQEDGVVVFTERRSLRPRVVNVISSRLGGAIISYAIPGGLGFYMGLYAQKIDPEGNLEWQEGGVQICRSRRAWVGDYMVGDNFNGASLVWGRRVERYYYLLHAQRVDSAGKLLWPERISVTAAPGGPFSMASDGDGGVFVAWVAHEFGPLRPYIQRISAEGQPKWGDEGILLNP